MTQLTSSKPILLSGDTPSGGRLHVGHWVGSIKTRVALQDSHDCYFIIANLHAFTTNPERGNTIRDNTLSIALDYLSAGIEPEKSTIFVQSDIPAIAELTYLFSMLLPFTRVMRNPTLKEELNNKGLEDRYSFGFSLYPVGQVADILAFKANRVPVGEDQLPHLEMTKEVARRFNQLYCGVSPHVTDERMVEQGGLFPIIQAEPTPAQRLVGLGPPNAQGMLQKMSKSLNNAIYLSDSADVIAKKIKKMYTDPNRLRATDPGCVDNNPLWKLHDALNPDKDWVEEAKARYRAGTIGDVVCKQRLTDIIIALTEPMRTRRELYAKDPQNVLDILRRGKERANAVAQETLYQVKSKMQQWY